MTCLTFQVESQKSNQNMHWWAFCCKKHNKMNTKLEQGIIEEHVVKNTLECLNKTIAFYGKTCYHKNSRDD